MPETTAEPLFLTEPTVQAVFPLDNQPALRCAPSMVPAGCRDVLPLALCGQEPTRGIRPCGASSRAASCLSMALPLGGSPP